MIETNEKKPIEHVLAEAKTPEYDPVQHFQQWGFFHWKNRYYYIEDKNGEMDYKPFTNFTMEVLYHMSNGNKPRRVIKLTNEYNVTKIVDIETDKLVSKSEFKKFCEGLGNFRFFGTEGKLDMLKAKLFKDEGTCEEITVLGWNDAGFWAWSNGIFNGSYKETDQNGFVKHEKQNFYIPAGNHHMPNRNKVFFNEIRFSHKQSKTNFKQFSKRYTEVFGPNGWVVLQFAVACIFSDIVYNARGFFPLLFMYGSGGSGKGSAIKFTQRLFGKPQDPLTLSGKANTDKAKIATFAQFVNTMLLLEEYTNNHDTDQLLKNLWDRYGYKRRTMDQSYRTESVPISSGVAITGNYIPTDDPLLQRIIFLEHNQNQFTQEEKDRFNNFRDFCELGVTAVTHEFCKLREDVDLRYSEAHKSVYKEVLTALAGYHVTDRMVENITVLLTIYYITADSLPYPYSYDELKTNLVNCTINQNKRRNTDSEAQKFFDIFSHLNHTFKLQYNVQWKVDGKFLRMFLKQIYPYYMEQHRSQYGSPGLGYNNLRDKLREHQAYELDEAKEKSCRINGQVSTSVSFLYDKNLLGINLDSFIEPEYGQRAEIDF